MLSNSPLISVSRKTTTSRWHNLFWPWFSFKLKKRGSNLSVFKGNFKFQFIAVTRESKGLFPTGGLASSCDLKAEGHPKLPLAIDLVQFLLRFFHYLPSFFAICYLSILFQTRESNIDRINKNPIFNFKIRASNCGTSKLAVIWVSNDASLRQITSPLTWRNLCPLLLLHSANIRQTNQAFWHWLPEQQQQQ